MSETKSKFLAALTAIGTFLGGLGGLATFTTLIASNYKIFTSIPLPESKVITVSVLIIGGVTALAAMLIPGGYEWLLKTFYLVRTRPANGHGQTIIEPVIPRAAGWGCTTVLLLIGVGATVYVYREALPTFPTADACANISPGKAGIMTGRWAGELDGKQGSWDIREDKPGAGRITLGDAPGTWTGTSSFQAVFDGGSVFRGKILGRTMCGYRYEDEAPGARFVLTRTNFKLPKESRPPSPTPRPAPEIEPETKEEAATAGVVGNDH